jgi:hypothetical protein
VVSSSPRCRRGRCPDSLRDPPLAPKHQSRHPLRRILSVGMPTLNERPRSPPAPYLAAAGPWFGRRPADYFAPALRQPCFADFVSRAGWQPREKSALHSEGSAARESGQTSGGVFYQAMPLSVILKTVALTRVASRLGSM